MQMSVWKKAVEKTVCIKENVAWNWGNNHKGRAAAQISFLILGLIGAVGFAAALFWGVVSILKALAIPIFLGWIVIYGLTSSKAPEPESPVDPVEEELARQRALEMQDDVLSLMFQTAQSTSAITPVVRPYSVEDILMARASGESFYMKGTVPIFQCDMEVEGELNRAAVVQIQEVMQRYARKHANRSPMLISSEAQGRSPVEILDVKPLGGHICVDVVLTTAVSIPLIEARRRARVERQQKQQVYVDMDYGE